VVYPILDFVREPVKLVVAGDSSKAFHALDFVREPVKLVVAGDSSKAFHALDAPGLPYGNTVALASSSNAPEPSSINSRSPDSSRRKSTTD